MFNRSEPVEGSQSLAATRPAEASIDPSGEKAMQRHAASNRWTTLPVRPLQTTNNLPLSVWTDAATSEPSETIPIGGEAAPLSSVSTPGTSKRRGGTRRDRSNRVRLLS